MRHMKTAWLAAIVMIVCGCSTTTRTSGSAYAKPKLIGQGTPAAGDRVPLRAAAKSLSLNVQPTSHEKDRKVVAPDGRSFWIMAGRPYYRFNGDSRPVSAPGVLEGGGELFLPHSMIQSMKRDLGMLKPKAAVAKKAPVKRKDVALKTRTVRKTTLKPAGVSARTRSVPPGTRIVIDAGHGGKDPGAVKSGVTEKSVNLAVSRKVAAKLRALGFEVIMTRTADTYPSLNERADLANRRSALAFVSIHANSASSKSASGVEVLYQERGVRGAASRKLGRSIVAAMVKATGAKNRRAKRDERGLRVLKRTRMPAVLVELGFLSNSAERRRLKTGDYQSRLAEGIVNGITSWVLSQDRSPALASRR